MSFPFPLRLLAALPVPILALGQAEPAGGTPIAAAAETPTARVRVASLAAEAELPPSQRTFDDGAYRHGNQPALDAAAARGPSVAELAPGLEHRTASFTIGTGPAADNAVPASRRLASPRSWTAVYDHAAPAVFIIHDTYQCGRCNHWHSGSIATAFGISPDGLIVTNYHVLDSDNPELRQVVIGIDGQAYPVVDILAANREQDIAVARIAVPAGETIPWLEIGERPAAGAEIAVLSHPDSRCWVMTRGIVSRHHQYRRSGDENAPVLQRMAIDADYARGSSGGPILDEQGRVVGVVATTSSVYYKGNSFKGADSGQVENPLQMVFHDTVPIACLLDLQAKPGEEPERAEVETVMLDRPPVPSEPPFRGTGAASADPQA